MTMTNPFPNVSRIYMHFPVPLVRHVKLVVEAGTPSDQFSCYCNLVEWLAGYLANLGNSVYAARPVDEVDEAIEQRLRATGPVASFGALVGGVRLFANLDYSATVSELREVLSARQLPAACVRMVRAFAAIKKGREEFEIPPAKLAAFVEASLGSSLGNCNLDGVFSAIVPFRNKGIGHQAEESWFPRDQRMYGIVCGYLAPAVDELLSWGPLRAVLSNYEVVGLAGRDPADPRAWIVHRPNITDGLAPLGLSRLIFSAALPTDTVPYVARRGEKPDELLAVVAHAQFPRTLQSTALLARRYADAYLSAYLEHGLITPTQRQSRLRPKVTELALPEGDRVRVEGEIQVAVDLWGPDHQARDESLRRLAALLGPRSADTLAQLMTKLDDLPARRKDYLFEQIDNNVIMSFAQLRAESELLEADLDTALGDLEQEDRVRRINGSGQVDRLSSHFKAQDPTKPSRLRGILGDLRRVPRKRNAELPAPLWRLIKLCADLLEEDGFVFPAGEIEDFADLFATDVSEASPPTEDDGGAMTLFIGGEAGRPSSVRQLFEFVVARLGELGIDPTPAVPLLIGKTRYLVAREPRHANGTPFAVPFELGDLYFEGNLTRAQALAEVIRFLQVLGIEANSPEVLLEAEAEIVDEPTTDDDEQGALVIQVFASGSTEATTIHGPNVRSFFAKLLDFLVDHDAPFAESSPIATGRVRYVLSEEPYHRNGRPFDSKIERDGYFVNTAYSYEQAVAAAAILCEKLGFRTTAEAQAEDVKLTMTIGDEVIDEPNVGSFLARAITVLFEQGRFTTEDIPYKSGRVRYLISEVPTHDHGRWFIRPVEIDLGGRNYFIEANMSRGGALELMQRLLVSKSVVPGAPAVPSAN